MYLHIKRCRGRSVSVKKAFRRYCGRFIAYCREQGIPVFFVCRRYAADGSNVERARYRAWLEGGKPLSPGCSAELSADMPPIFSVDERDRHIFKPRYSAFFSTELDLILRRLHIRRLLLAGTTTPNCIRATCYDGLSLDYGVTVLSDCTSSVTDEIQQSNLKDMENVGARILSSDEWFRQLEELHE